MWSLADAVFHPRLAVVFRGDVADRWPEWRDDEHDADDRPWSQGRPSHADRTAYGMYGRAGRGWSHGWRRRARRRAGHARNRFTQSGELRPAALWARSGG